MRRMEEPEESHQEAPSSGGRRNAIVTYERVDQLASSVADVKMDVLRANGKLDTIGGRLEDLGKTHFDHEVRIRSLELSNAGVIAANTRGASVWNWVWGACIAVPSLVLAFLTYTAGH